MSRYVKYYVNYKYTVKLETWYFQEHITFDLLSKQDNDAIRKLHYSTLIRVILVQYYQPLCTSFAQSKMASVLQHVKQLATTTLTL